MDISTKTKWAIKNKPISSSYDWTNFDLVSQNWTINFRSESIIR